MKTEDTSPDAVATDDTALVHPPEREREKESVSVRARERSRVRVCLRVRRGQVVSEGGEIDRVDREGREK